MEEDFLTLLNSTSPQICDGRIVWGERNKGEDLPAISLFVISGTADYHMQGSSNLHQTRVQVNCFGRTMLSAIETERAVAALVSGFRGIVGGTDFNGVFVVGRNQMARSSGARDVGDDPDAIKTRSVDLMLHYKEDVT